MADVKESAMSQKNDCKWVRALDSNGNSILISKEDLASVVGGLLPESTNTNKGAASTGMFKAITVNSKGIKITPNKSSYTFINYRAIVYDNGHCYLYDIIFSSIGLKSVSNFHVYKVFGTRDAPKLKQDSNGNLYIFPSSTSFNNTGISLYCISQVNSAIPNITYSEVTDFNYSSLEDVNLIS